MRWNYPNLGKRKGLKLITTECFLKKVVNRFWRQKKAENILLQLLFKVFMLFLRHSPLVFKIQAYKKVLKETII